MPAGPLADAVTSAEDAVVQLTMTVSRRFRARLDGDTVDPAQAALLHVLKCQGAMRLGDLAEAMRLDASTVSRHVHQLGERGLIERELDPEDGRARIVALSAAGAESLRTSFALRRAFITEALDRWDDHDRERLRTLLSRLGADLDDA